MSNVLVTGANGFVGRGLVNFLALNGNNVLGVVRARSGNSIFGSDNSSIKIKNIDSISGTTDWSGLLGQQEVVVHTAARAHVMNDKSLDPLLEYRKINVDGSLNLAKQCAENNVRRFVFISSIKVNGESTTNRKAFDAGDYPSPEDAYGISKYEAELGLMDLAKTTGMEVVIVRPPLVYGPGVKGNFANLIKLVERGIPVPLGMVDNKRSLIALDNLIDLIARCIDHPLAANKVFLASDGFDLSTSELFRGLAKAMGKKSRLIPVPSIFLQFAASVIGKQDFAKRLLGSLQVDIAKTCEILNWKPPVSVEEGLSRCFTH